MMNRIISSEFDKTFNGTIILDHAIEIKLKEKHKVYKGDLLDALSDPYTVVMRAKQKSPIPQNKLKTYGTVYEILAETESTRVLFVIGRLFPDGNLYIITAYWASSELESLYNKESEILKND
jgi:hypothetical protein